MKSWEEIKTVDDLVLDVDKKIIDEVKEELKVRCPHLRRLGNYFYYCGGGIPKETRLEFDPFNPIIIAHQETVQIQLHCMDRYNDCCHYKGTLPFPGSQTDNASQK